MLGQKFKLILKFNTPTPLSHVQVNFARSLGRWSGDRNWASTSVASNNRFRVFLLTDTNLLNRQEVTTEHHSFPGVLKGMGRGEEPFRDTKWGHTAIRVPNTYTWCNAEFEEVMDKGVGTEFSPYRFDITAPPSSDVRLD